MTEFESEKRAGAAVFKFDDVAVDVAVEANGTYDADCSAIGLGNGTDDRDAIAVGEPPVYQPYQPIFFLG